MLTVFVLLIKVKFGLFQLLFAVMVIRAVMQKICNSMHTSRNECFTAKPIEEMCEDIHDNKSPPKKFQNFL